MSAPKSWNDALGKADLNAIANTPGYGSGKRARDRMAAEADALSILPDPRALPIFVASGDDEITGGRLPLAQMGNSVDDGRDWGVYHDGVTEADAMGHDAKDDAQIVAAILNAYRMGLLVRKD